MDRARQDLQAIGINMPPKLREMFRSWTRSTYDVAARAQRDALIAELEQSPEGRAALERHKLKDH